MGAPLAQAAILRGPREAAPAPQDDAAAWCKREKALLFRTFNKPRRHPEAAALARPSKASS
jgi:hypothetical protein